MRTLVIAAVASLLLHVGRVIRVIGGDPFGARVAASTSQQAAALAGVGQGHTTVEAG
jgi:hypothetical protein